MAKCENCIHHGICDENRERNHRISKSVCKHFKDKDLIAELPCKVGDELFEISGSEIYIWEVMEIIINSDIDFECRDAEFEDYYGSFTLSDIGEKVYLTFEEAEAALKERENNETRCISST